MNNFNYNKINGDKQQFRTTLSLIQGDAIRYGVEVDVFTILEYQAIPGNAGLIPNPLTLPVEPAVGASRHTWRRFELATATFKERNTASKGIRSAVINILRDQDVASIEHYRNGMRDVTVQEILQRLKETLLTVTIADIKAEETKLIEGIPYDIEIGIHAFLGKYKSCFLILESNANTISNMKKIEHVQEALKKLRCVEINGFLADWNRQNSSIAAKVFETFERDLINIVQSISKETLKNAGYSAKMLEAKDATIAVMQDQIQTQQDELQALKVMVANTATANQKNYARDKWCCTHMWGNHLSKECTRPKDGHNKNELQPPNTSVNNKKRKKL
jgi:hypothetical protein